MSVKDSCPYQAISSFLLLLLCLFIFHFFSELQLIKHGSLICELSLSGKFFKKTESLCFCGFSCLLFPSLPPVFESSWGLIAASTTELPWNVRLPYWGWRSRRIGRKWIWWRGLDSWSHPELPSWKLGTVWEKQPFRFKPLQGSLLLLTKSCFKLSFQIHTLGKHIVESDLTSFECEIQVFQGTI